MTNLESIEAMTGPIELAQAKAAVDGEDLAGDEVRGRGKIHHGAYDVIRRSIPFHWRMRGQTLEECRSFFAYSRIDHARRDAIYGNLRRQGLGHYLSKHVQRCLGRTVMRVRGPRLLTAQRSHMNDAAVSAAQRRDAGLRDQEWRTHVDSEHFVPLFGGDVFNIRGFKDAGVVDQQVDLTKLLQHIFDRNFRVGGLAKITFESVPPNALGLDLFQCLVSFVGRREEGKCDVRAGLGHGERDSFAQAARGARDEDGFAFQVGHARNCKRET